MYQFCYNAPLCYEASLKNQEHCLRKEPSKEACPNAHSRIYRRNVCYSAVWELWEHPIIPLSSASCFPCSSNTITAGLFSRRTSPSRPVRTSHFFSTIFSRKANLLSERYIIRRASAAKHPLSRFSSSMRGPVLSLTRSFASTLCPGLSMSKFNLLPRLYLTISQVELWGRCELWGRELWGRCGPSKLKKSSLKRSLLLSSFNHLGYAGCRYTHVSCYLCH